MREDFDTDPKKPNPYVEPRVRKSTLAYFPSMMAHFICRRYSQQVEAGAGY